MKKAWIAALAFGTFIPLGLGLAQKAPINVAGDFKTPESILVDVKRDEYLVSNINGAPTDKDNNGFISRVAPDGKISELKWLEGGKNGLTLNAPKGMALVGNTLYVADLDVVRVFNRSSKRSLGAIPIPGDRKSVV